MPSIIKKGTCQRVIIEGSPNKKISGRKIKFVREQKNISVVVFLKRLFVKWLSKMLEIPCKNSESKAKIIQYILIFCNFKL